MFDVSWADPMRETVGQRKTRKDQESSSSTRRSSVHTAKSSESSSVQSRPSVVNVLGGKKQTLSLSRSHTKLFSSYAEDSVNVSTTTSSFKTSSEDPDRELSSRTQCSINEDFTESSYSSDAEQCSLSDASGSVFSGWTDRSRRADSIWTMAESTTSSERIVQPLGPRSYVTRCTEVKVSPRECLETLEQVSTVVHISATKPIPNEAFESAPTISPTATFDSIVPGFNHDDGANSITSSNNKHSDIKPTGWPFNAQDRKLNSWKPPEAWQCPLDDPKTPGIKSPKSVELPFRPQEKRAAFTNEMSDLQRKIRRMEAASQDVVLQRLKEESVGIDASASLGLELEKKLWMLCALRRQLGSRSCRGSSDSPASKPTKILCLYENHAFSSFLSVVTTATELHHLSSTPLSSEFNPIVWPLSVPSPSPRLPYATGIFSDIHAFPLPALLPASLIPQLLKECHRTLTSSVPPSPSYSETISSSTTKGGKIHFTILNPIPLPDTLGPRLRDWLDKHLIFNLERQFRCVNPGRLFPIWLADAGLHGEGTSVISTKFFACVSPKLLVSPKRGRSGSAGNDADENEAKNEELKSLVGRMLWKEMWGSFVEGEGWWWDDERVVEECKSRGTCWEYAVIEAVKEG